MKQIILNVILFLNIINCKGQKIKETVNINTLKKDTMEYFNEEEYKNWKLDKENSFTTDKKYIKGNTWVRIIISNEGYREEIEQLNSPYETIKIYHKNLSLRIKGSSFYGFAVGIDKEYDENGKLIKEIDNDKNYPFKVEDLCNLIKEEYGVDLMIKSNPNKEELQYRVSRSYDSSRLKHLYLVSFTYGNPDIEPGDKILPPIKVVYIEGSNGKILYEESSSLNLPNGDKIPNSKTKFPQKGGKVKKTSKVYKNHQGKSYTKTEWEDFEEKQYKEYCKRTGRSYTSKNESREPRAQNQEPKSQFIAEDGEKGDHENPKKKKGFLRRLFS
ncbi:hypothetical protein V3Q90_15885 [Flavobacterium oreochromis]|uniref:Lipoprotein n=1 Tax=Flavobacterium oreochromis TaxID=2906078 RepID=A0ABW8PC95_9FLAO